MLVSDTIQSCAIVFFLNFNNTNNMTVSEYLVDYLIRYNVTDAFGLPGGVILDFMYAMKAREGEINPHLSYHEQAAAFAAVGYAQASGNLGVAYATRGPGFTNMITAIADAYCDSVPTLFITSHAAELNSAMRLSANQEIDTCAMVEKVTKFCKRIDSVEDFAASLEFACQLATTGRKGPVFLDIASKLWKKEVPSLASHAEVDKNDNIDYSGIISDVSTLVKQASRPIILIGDGVNQNKVVEQFNCFAEKAGIPVLSSRYAHNVMGNSNLYYGYIGGFGVRYANFILSKADLIISLGNRLNFPLKSETYSNIPNQAKIVRFEIDEGELSKEIPNALSYKVDIKELLPVLASSVIDFGEHSSWILVCDQIRKDLWDEDVDNTVSAIERIMNAIPDASILNDVGVNEFWVSRACAHVMRAGSILYSKSFATLGCSMVKAIGAYYATKKPVLCYIGDQGFQMNSQELHYIAQHQLPITIVVLNNSVSGMIRDKEVTAYSKTLHSTSADEYQIPNLKMLAEAYGLAYQELDTVSHNDFTIENLPTIINLRIDSDLRLKPTLPRGHKPQDMVPALEDERYNRLNCL